ncbi:unnamed protein product [Schistocephalus solidus]|uniref:C2H2-type domain-containing protein n=1 Tax=Schistocephalus solidus TaxID=70667 RepID=A0A183SNZ7_SCHSO|nr:unnamed protein product [Schistocephalus solidus]
MLLWPPLTGTQLSPVAPRSWVLPIGHTPGNRHDRWAKPGEGLRYCVCLHTRPAWRRSVKTGASIYEANRIAAAKAKRAARKSQAPWINTANAQALSTCPHCQRTFHAPARSHAYPRKRNPPRYQHILRTHNPLLSSTTSTSNRAPQTQHLQTYLALIVTAHARHASAWLVTCESIAQRPANPCQDHQNTPTALDATIRTAHAHSHTTWAYKVTCVSMKTCDTTPPAIPQLYISPHQLLHFT